MTPRNSFTILFVILSSVPTLFDTDAIVASETIRDSGTSDGQKVFRANWRGEGRWIGRAWWANPLWDWKRVGNDRVSAPAAKDRSLVLLPFELGSQGTSFTMQTTISFKKNSTNDYVPASIAAGFGLGLTGPLPDYRSAAVYSDSQMSAIITRDGKLTIAGNSSSSSVSLTGGSITLLLEGTKSKTSVSLSLTARQYHSKVVVKTIVPVSNITGPFALVTSGVGKSAEDSVSVQVTFEKFAVSGTMVKRFTGRMLGAIMWSQYTLSENTLRLQAQLAPIDVPVVVKLTIRSAKGGNKVKVVSSLSDSLSRTAQFTIENWDSQNVWWYDVQAQVMSRLHTWSGMIQKEPSAQTPFKIAAFSCDEGYLFPQSHMVEQVNSQTPDFMYFAGDQMYSPTAGFGLEQFGQIDVLMLDFLRRWYLFGWTWRNLLATRPSVILPDDHDIYQGNLWGDGGKALDKPEDMSWDSGGYLMPGPWISAVERCHTGHLPPPQANFTTPLGLRPYFTSLTYGGLSMAVLEDRKFKSAPLTFSNADMISGKGGHLLGAEQEKFLEKWVRDWAGSSMKVAFSQTIFCNAATHTGYKLSRSRYFYDSGAWPIDARNRAVRLMGEGNVISLHGDQHLGMLMRHGVYDHDDAGVAFMVPGTANGFPRAWWPGVTNILNPGKVKFTGKFIDDAGHPITVLAVGNPKPGNYLLDSDTTPRLQIGRVRGSGYGLVVLDRMAKSATFHLYKVGNKNDEFHGFPKKVFIGGAPY